jgi:hypothetical protein
MHSVLFQRTWKTVKLPSEITERTILITYDHIVFHVLVGEIMLAFLKFRAIVG